MNSNEPPAERSRPIARPFFVFLLVLAIIAAAVFYRTKPVPAPINLIAIGTNTLKAQMMIYDPHSRRFRGEVLATDNAHEFPDGTIRPGVLLKAVNGIEAWVPRENLREGLVEVP